jgi:hypothetical protein
LSFELTATVFDFTATGMFLMLVATGAMFFLLQLLRGLFIDARRVISHGTSFANHMNIGVFSSWHDF